MSENSAARSAEAIGRATGSVSATTIEIQPDGTESDRVTWTAETGQKES